MFGAREIVRRLHEAYNARRFDAYGELLADDAVLIMHGDSIRGRAGFCDYVVASVRELPGVAVQIERVLADTADTFIVETRYVDSSPGPASERAAPSAWRLPFSLCECYRVSNAVVTECRNYPGAELVEQLTDGAAPWPGITQLVAEQAALRRMATLVAQGATQPEVFDAVVAEAGELLGENVLLARFDGEDTTTNLAHHTADGVPDLTGITTHRGDGPARPVHTGRPVRVDSYAGIPGPGAEYSRRLGVQASAAAPIVLEGERWGALVVFSRVELTVGIEDRLARFADLIATALANTQSRAELQLLADEQAALRRVAELVARGAATQEVFDQVTAEASRLLGDLPNALERYENSGAEVTIVAEARLATLGVPDERYVRGARLPVIGDTARARVWRTGHTIRIDDYEGVAGAETVRRGARASVAAPVVVNGRLWGVLTTGGPVPPLPAGTEQRLTRFCELVAAAIANAESRTQLTASRARIVASGDEARRRLARDVHDGAQQRLVHAIIMLKQAATSLHGTSGPAAALVGDSLQQAEAANEQLRDLARGIMPAALAGGGLRAAVETLRTHVPLKVDADVVGDRLPERAELTAYFVISEALTNVVKHAGAGSAQVRVTLGADRLRIEVSDDGEGGADPAAGSGLVGLADRVDAAAGTFSLTSPSGGGTTLSVELPVDSPGSAGFGAPPSPKTTEM